MAINIKNKRSSVVNKAPDPGALAAGEIAVNYNANSPALYIEDAGGSVVKIANGVTDLGTANVTTTTLDVTNSTGTDATLPAATTSTAGLLSSADKTKLDLQPATPHWQRTGTTISPSTSGDNLEIGGTAEVDGASTFNAVVENTSGGYKFPDGTVQLTAADPAGQTYSLQQVTTTGNTTTNDIILGSNKIQLTAVSGDITSAGDIQVGGNPNSGTAAGSRVESAGVIKAAGSVDGDSTFEGYVVGTSTPTCKILADGSITSNETLTVLGSVAGVEATISNATIKSKINTGNTQPYFQGQKGSGVVFEASHDGGVLAAGDIKIGGTLPSAPNITLANTGSISANGGLNIGSGSYSGFAATIDGSSGQVFAGQINGKNVSGSADSVANTFAGINSSGTQTFSVKADGNITTSGNILTDGEIKSGNWGFANIATRLTPGLFNAISNTATPSADYVFRAYHNGYNPGDTVFGVKYDGSITAEGTITTSGGLTTLESVGIGGTTVTDSNLLNLQGSSASVNIGVVFNDTNTSQIYGIQNVGSALKFHDYTASATRMVINSSGVGIGTSSPLTPLDVVKSGDNVVSRFSNGTRGLEIAATSTGGSLQTYNASQTIDIKTFGSSGNDIKFSTSATERMRIDPSGNVKVIGTGTVSAPNIELNANGSVSAGDAAFGSGTTRLKTYSDSTYSGIYNGSSLTSDESIYMGGGSTFFLNNGSESLRIDSSGNVGVGVAPFTSARVTAPHLVVGDGSNAPGLTLYGASNAQASINFGDSTSGTSAYDGGIVYDFQTQNLSFHTNGGVSHLIIEPDGDIYADGRFNAGSSNLNNRAIVGYSGGSTAGTITANQYFVNGPVWQAYNSSINSSLATSTIFADGRMDLFGTLNLGGGYADATGGISAFSAGGLISARASSENLNYVFQGYLNGTGVTTNIDASGNATFSGNLQVGGNSSSGANAGAYLHNAGFVAAARSSSGDAVWRSFVAGSSTEKISMTAGGNITAAGTGTFGVSTAQRVNLRPGQSGTSDAIWLQNADNTRPFLVGANGNISTSGSVQAGPFSPGSSTGKGTYLDSNGNIGIQVPSTTALTNTMIYSMLGTDIRFSVNANGSVTTNGDYQAGGNPDSGTAVGTRSNANGSHQACGGDDNVVVYEGFKQGSSTARFKVFAGGDANFYGSITAANVSDIRFKKNIEDANPQLEDVVSLGSQLKNYDWTDDAPLNDKLRARRFLGLVAQEAEKVCPELTYTVPQTKQGEQLTPEEVIPAVYEEKIVPAVIGDDGEIIEPETTENVLVTPEQVIPATYEELDDSYKAINHDILVMKLLGAVAELSAKVEALTQA
mgnify:CR=1 FL=1